jgi:hypothetical protein
MRETANIVMYRSNFDRLIAPLPKDKACEFLVEITGCALDSSWLGDEKIRRVEGRHDPPTAVFPKIRDDYG